MAQTWKTVRGFKNVQEFIDSAIIVSQFTVENLPLPQGLLLVDATGSSIAIWWDIMEQCVCYNVEVCNA